MEIKKDVEILVQDSESMALQYQVYTIINNESLLGADSDLSKIKTRIKQLEDERLEITRPMDASKKKIMDLFKKPIEALEQARKIINTEMTKYKSAQEAIRQEQERQARELARKEEERQKKILAEKIARAEASGKLDKVEELKEKVAEVFVPAPIIQSTVVETKNKPRQVWKYRVTNLSLVPKEYLMIDDVKMGQVVRATKGTLPIAGIEIYSEDSKF